MHETKSKKHGAKCDAHKGLIAEYFNQKVYKKVQRVSGLFWTFLWTFLKFLFSQKN